MFNNFLSFSGIGGISVKNKSAASVKSVVKYDGFRLAAEGKAVIMVT